MTKSTHNFLKYTGCLAGYFLAVLAIFLLVQKPIFIIYNHSFLPQDFGLSDLWQICL